ncbi:ABC transporter ATP-binding protein [Conexibacter sp. CPCC 206217]|uniref:ABC transporter ATP-binding protein n=1 Tax=Conexibacter sp. CPCC 206217 TaxID=3064574 RepID=UPI00271705B9|nr:ABC transporter ATP-binding protein [Conexibacter sp. CPCC 206217]MDO8212671.1 ABC transporter ATP-binding protein [Conexibacter sp. CPCC 206217]
MSAVAGETRAATDVLVEVRGLVKHFPLPARGVPGRRRHEVVHALNGVDLDVRRGEFIALVGESGSGKTTLANCIAGFLDPTAGAIRLDGSPLVEAREGRRRVSRHVSRRALARDVQMIFQDPSSALNPRQTIASALLEPLLVHKVLDKRAAQTRVRELLSLTGIPATMGGRYPHELNSGQRQRAVIARALALNPRLIVADEAVSRLDVSMQSQILNLLLDLHRDLGLTIVFITHDLSVVRQVADSVVVMYLGRIMEACAADVFFAQPSHPYSNALIASTPRMLREDEQLQTLEGEIPSPVRPPSGCPFHTRCPLAEERCTEAVPPLEDVAPGHRVACIKA